MTNLGAGFSVGSPETPGPPPSSSSGLSSERDRYRELFESFDPIGTALKTPPVGLCSSSRQLMPPPLLPVNGVRPKMEERRPTQGPVGKAITPPPGP